MTTNTHLVASAAARGDPAWRPVKPDGYRAGAVFLLVFGALAAGIVFAGYLTYRHHERRFRDEVQLQLSSVADLKASELAHWRRERMEDGAFFFQNTAFAALVRRAFGQPADLDALRELRGWLDRVRRNSQFDLIALLDAQGAERPAASGQPEPLACHLTQDAVVVLRSGQVTLQDIHRDAPGGPVRLAVLVPIFDESPANLPLGVLVLRIDPTTYLFPFIRRWPTPSLTAETLLVRREGNEVVYLNELRFQTNAALNKRVPLDRLDMPAVQAVLGRYSFMEGVDYRDVPVVAALRTVPDSPWALVARMDVAEAYAPMRDWLWQMVGLLGALLLSAFACVSLVWRQQHVRFYRARAEAAEMLRASEVRYRRLFETTKDGILTLDAETGMVTDVNPFLIELLGFSRETFVGTPVWELGFFKDIVANRDHFVELQQKEYIRYEDMALETADGRRIEVEFVSNVYLVNRDKVVQCNIRDISARKRAEKAKAVAHKALEDKTEEMESLLYASSHDLRTPLVNIQGFGQRLEKAVADLAGLLATPVDGATLRAAMLPIVQERMPAALRYVVAGTERMDVLIGGLLRLSRLTRVELKPEPLDMDQLVRNVIAAMEHQVRAAGAELRVEPLPPCRGEACQIGQVVSNLLDNALKYRDPRRPLRVAVSGTAQGHEVVYCVEDSGKGIKPEYLDRIWRIFVRIDPRDAAPGEGMGLAVVRRIVQRHGGRAWVESAPGEGSRFYFALPYGATGAKDCQPERHGDGAMAPAGAGLPVDGIGARSTALMGNPCVPS